MPKNELAPHATGDLVLAPERPQIAPVSFGRYVPKTVLTNEDIESWGIGLTARAIERATGVERRYIAQDHETQYFMASEAMDQALSGKRPDIIIVSESHLDSPANTAGALAQEFGFNLQENHLKRATAACCGAVLGLSTLYQPQHDSLRGANVLLIGSERYHDKVVKMQDNPEIRDETIFGDGAFAIFMPNFGTDEGVKIISQPINGFMPYEYRDAIKMATHPEYINRNQKDGKGDIYIQIPQSKSGKFEMDGKRVLEAVSDVPRIIKGMLRDSMLSPDTVDHFVFHQGSGPVLRKITQGLGPEFEGRIPTDYQDGNYSSASVIKVLDKLHQQGQLRKGGKVAVCAVGAGVYTSSLILQLGR